MGSTLSCVPDDFQPPSELVDFVKRQIRDAPVSYGAERRMEERYLMLVPVLAQPLDAEFRPMGEPFLAVTRDISRGGIGLVHSHPIRSPMVSLRMSLAGEEVKVVAKVKWCEALGPYYYLGGEFARSVSGGGEAGVKGESKPFT